MAFLLPTDTDPLAAFGPLVADRVPDTFGSAPYELFGFTPLTPTIGAEITGVRVTGGLDRSVMEEIRRALLEWKVLVFRDQDIDRSDQRGFATYWGELEQHPFFQHMHPGQTEVDVTTLAKDAETWGNENNWHNDVSWRSNPSFAAVLRAVEVPLVGGDTLWSDMGAAYDLLPDEIKERIDHLHAEHDWISSFGMTMNQETVAELRPVFPPVSHPVVRVIPETGRRVLFVNMIFTQRILDVAPEESAALLTVLYRHCMRPEFQVRLKWQPNTVVMWDNRSCQHYASSDYYPQRRVMDRISIVGDVPVGIDASSQRDQSSPVARTR